MRMYHSTNGLGKRHRKTNKILDMKSEIQKYFAVSGLAPFRPNATWINGLMKTISA